MICARVHFSSRDIGFLELTLLPAKKDIPLEDLLVSTL